ncbi:MAG: Imm10 family immunity protein [Actinocrinis sp.]
MPSPDFATVALVTVDENVDAFTVGLAENEAGEGAYLILQCAVVPPTAQDAATGMDTYCVMDENGVVRYGGIERVELIPAATDVAASTSTATLKLRFDEDAAAELDVESSDRQIALAVPTARAVELAAGLRRVLTYGPPARHPDLVGI